MVSRGPGFFFVLCGLWGCGNAVQSSDPPGAGAGGGPSAAGGAGAGGSHAAAPAGGRGGGAGSAAASGAGAGGAPPDPCWNVVCTAPPAATCEGYSLRSYDALGSCSNGTCQYGSHLSPCGAGCSDGHCMGADVCTVTCDSTPQATCTNEHTLSTRHGGLCEGSLCSYYWSDTACPFGCAAGACLADPCANVDCTLAPAICKDAHTKTTYGSCNAGTCSDATTDTACSSNQQCSGAGVCSPCATDTACGASCAACGGATPKCKSLGLTSQCVACLADLDCGANARCDVASNTCIALKADGAPCAVDLDCASKSCGGSCCPTGTSCYCPQPSPGNLLTNPVFDKDLSGWNAVSQGTDTFAYANAAKTKGDCPFSGSLELTTGAKVGSESAQFSQCVTIDPASTKSYYFGAAMRNGDSSGNAPCTLGECYLQWMSGASCAAPEGTAPIRVQSSSTAWGFSVSPPLVRPVAASSANVACLVRSGASGGSCVFGFDQLSFTEAPDKF